MLTQTSSMLTQTSSMAGQISNQAQKPADPTQIQACVQLLEEQAIQLRAVAEHLVSRLHDVLIPSAPEAQQTGDGANRISTCPLFDMLGAQITHVAVSRAIMEDLLRRIQL
jgi:hypothetical protein